MITYTIETSAQNEEQLGFDSCKGNKKKFTLASFSASESNLMAHSSTISAPSLTNVYQFLKGHHNKQYQT